MISEVLPPLDCSAPRPTTGARLLNVGLVVGLHLLLGYAALYLSVRNELIALPPSISVRLLPLADPPKPEAAKPLPLPPKPAAPVPRPQAPPPPVLAVAAPAAEASSFVVAPQPPAPAVPPPVAAPAPVATVAARFDADYLHNPKPVYPAMARRNGEEGKVLLKVRVSAQGAALEVAVAKSSGSGRLDTAAVEAVTRWRFVPARRGDEAVESSVMVPITFALE